MSLKGIRKMLSSILAFAMILTFSTHAIEAEEKEVQWEAQITKDEVIDVPFESGKGGGPVSVFDVSFGTEQGRDVAYTASKGSGDYPAVFNVIDIVSGENIFNEKMEGATQVWSIITVGEDVYIGTTGHVARLWRYRSKTKTLENLGAPLNGVKTMFTLSSDGEKVYGGGHPTGKLFSYDIETNTFEDLGVVDKGVREVGIEDLDQNEDYIRSSAIYKDYIYVGTGSQNGRVFRKNIKTNSEWELLEMSVSGREEEFSDLKFVYDLKVVRNYLFAFFNGNKNIYIYDLEEEVWLDQKIPAVRGQIGVSSEYKSHVYYASDDKNMYRFNLDTMEKDETPLFSYDANLRSTTVLEREGKEVMMSIEFNGNLRLLDFNDGFKKDFVEADVVGQPQAIQSMHYDQHSAKLFASAYQGAQGYRRDIKTNEVTKFGLGQIENMDVLDGNIYFGEYPQARFFTMGVNDENPKVKELYALGSYKQDRPFKVHGHEGKLYSGTIGDYGVLDGSLSIYDVETEDLKVYPGIIENQSIVGVAVKDHLVYGSTTIHGGLGINPKAKTAKVFIFDTIQEEVILEKEIDELSHQNVEMISGLTFDDKGRLWAVANGSILELSTKDLSVIRKKDIYPSLNAHGQWRPVEVNFVNGKMYANVGFILNVIDPETLAHAEIVKAEKYVVSEDERIFYADQVLIKELSYELVEKGYQVSDVPVLNNSFETVDEFNRPLNWSSYHSTIKDDTYYEISESIKTEGDKSLKIFDRDGGASMFVRSDKIDIKPGAIYEVSADHYLENGKATLMMRFYDENDRQVGKDIGHKTIVHSEGNYKKWQELTVNGEVPQGATNLRISVGTNNAAQTDGAYFDNIKLTEKIHMEKGPEVGEQPDPQIPSEEGNLLNPSFEKVDDKGQLLAWTSLMNHDNDKVFYSQAKEGFEQDYSLFIKDMDTSKSMFVASHPMKANEGNQYDVAVKIKFTKDNTAYRKGALLIRFYDENDKQISKDVSGTTHTVTNGDKFDWETLSLSALAPRGTHHMRVILGTNNQQSTNGVYYDDVKVDVVKQKAEPITINHEYLDFDGSLLNRETQTLNSNVIGEKAQIDTYELEDFIIDSYNSDAFSDVKFSNEKQTITIFYNRVAKVIVNHNYMDKNNNIVGNTQTLYTSVNLGEAVNIELETATGYQFHNKSDKYEDIKFEENVQELNIYYKQIKKHKNPIKDFVKEVKKEIKQIKKEVKKIIKQVDKGLKEINKKIKHFFANIFS